MITRVRIQIGLSLLAFAFLVGGAKDFSSGVTIAIIFVAIWLLGFNAKKVMVAEEQKKACKGG